MVSIEHYLQDYENPVHNIIAALRQGVEQKGVFLSGTIGEGYLLASITAPQGQLLAGMIIHIPEGVPDNPLRGGYRFKSVISSPLSGPHMLEASLPAIAHKTTSMLFNDYSIVPPITRYDL